MSAAAAHHSRPVILLSLHHSTCHQLTPSHPTHTQPQPPKNTSFRLPAKDIPGAPLDAIHTACLVLLNVDSKPEPAVEGLWRATSLFTDPLTGQQVIEFQVVGAYAAVPPAVWSDLLTVSPWKPRYDGDEALAVVQALWEHGRPAREAAAAAAAAAPAGPLVAPAPASRLSASSSQPLVTVASRPVAIPALAAASVPAPAAAVAAAQQPPAAGEAGQQQQQQQQQQPLRAATPPPASELPPPTIRPAAAKPTAAAAKAKAAPAAAEPAAAATGSDSGGAAAAAGGGKGGIERCTLCRENPPGWLVLNPCKHTGPCWSCLPPPGDAKLLIAPKEYPVCLKCSKPVKQLFRIVIST